MRDQYHRWPKVETRQGLAGIVDEFRPSLQPFEALYKHIHSHPELGTQESQTAVLVAQHLKHIDLDVKEGIGGYGVAGILRNGAGPVVLIRAELDALPVLEETGLPYASKVRARDNNGVETPVMHACGHDLHIACLLATMQLLKSAKSRWSGTVISVFQPNEEEGRGAKAMVEDGLYEKVPIPDIILFQHVDHQRTGTVSIGAGPTQAAADSFDVRIFGRGGHGAQPESAIDPIVIASYIIVRLQSIVSRDIAPSDMVVITCGSIHAGKTENIIPDHLDLKLNVRTFDQQVRKKVLERVKCIINAECEASNVPKAPQITATTSFPVTNNDPKVVDGLWNTWQGHFGDNLQRQQPKAASEDLPNLANTHGIPYAVWFCGGTDAQKWDDAVKRKKLELIPRNHSGHFAPVIQPTLRTAVDAMSLAVLTFLCRESL
jgi:amidohydrolase